MNVRNKDHPSNVLRELNSQRERAELTDVILEVEGKSFPCHRAVLASCSPYFRAMFTSSYTEARQDRVSIRDVSAVAMETILDYAYTGCLATEPDQVQAVMSAAKLLQVGFVGYQASEFMRAHLDVSNCADVLMYADMYADCWLVECSNRYIASRFKEAVLQPSFLQLSLHRLYSLLDRDDLITQEDDVAQAALKWIDFNQAERSQHLPILCKTLRLRFISAKQREEIESRHPSSSDSELVYSKSRSQRLGHVRTEMQIVLPGCSYLDEKPYVPCYNPSIGGQCNIDLPDDLELESYSMAATPDGDLYLAGDFSYQSDCGLTTKDNRQKKFYLYNHLLNTWEPRCEMLANRARCELVALNENIYAIGGDHEKGMAERYDPSQDEWTSIPPFPHPVSSRLCVVALDDSIYVITKEGCHRFSTTENRWDKIADMIQPPEYPQAVTYRGSIYCVNCGDSRHTIRTHVEVYNPAVGVWKCTGDVDWECSVFGKLTLMTHGGTLYLISVHVTSRDQWNQEPATIYVDKYQPETDSWSFVLDKGWLVPPRKCLESECQTSCLVARLIPKCLGCNTNSELEDYLLDGETSDEISDSEDSQSGSDDDGDS